MKSIGFMKRAPHADRSILDFELEIIQMIVEFGRMMGMQRSVCEIYGLLIASMSPIAMEDICKKLGMSLGSVSQGLRLLKDLGAVRTVYQKGKRRDFYQAEFDFREIVTSYMREKIQPTLDSSAHRFEKIEASISQLPEEEREGISDRIEIMRRLNRRARKVIPAMSKILSL